MDKANLIFELCSFQKEPIIKTEYIKLLNECLGELPPTITTKDIELAQELGIKEGDLSQINAGDTGTSPLHKVCESLDPNNNDPNILETAHGLIDNLFYYGANWMMLDDNNETPGCIALRRGLSKSIYDKFVSAGVRAEVFLRRVTEDDDEEETNVPQKSQPDAAENQQSYLASKLKYEEDRLITESQNDGVMMDWESPIMKKSAELICSAAINPREENVVLNVGFGMGIIDGYIQDNYRPTKHYISEAHPDVLAKLKADGWYENPNVVILEGRWQETLPQLLADGVTFDGMYYDTFSEHYKDLVDFFDIVVSLLKPTGVFSFFNGLGADRQICYDVYSQVVEVDLQDYGMEVSYSKETIEDHQSDETWDGIRRQYWTLKEYLLPKIKFLEVGI